jgi:Glycosyltransferase Family 4
MKLLLIAYYYPPMGGAGVQRALKFSKYLGEFGVQTVVLAADDRFYTHDASLLAEVPTDVPVHRIEHQPLLQRVLGWRARLQRRSTVAEQPPGAAVVAAIAAARSDARARLRDALLSAYAAWQFPDDKAGWARRAFAPACDIVRREGIDLILSSAPPMSSHGLAARLSRACGVPWVADYRDLWTDNPAYAAPAWRRALDRRTEARWLAGAAGIVAVTPSLQHTLNQRVQPGCAVALIPNGYDEADFAALQPAPRADGICRIVHAGTFYGHQTPLPILAAAEALLTREPALARRLRLRFVGEVGSRFTAALDAFDRRFPEVLERTGYVEHQRAVAQMLAADVLLLVIGGGTVARGVLSGKLFEYLRAARPVLLIGPVDGDAARLLRAHARCRVSEEADTAQIADALRAAVVGEAWPALPGGAAPQTFERRELTRQLADFLRACRERARG